MTEVRKHQRTTASGKTVTVHRHERRGGAVSPGHAGKLARKAFNAGKRRKRVRATVLGVLALGEIIAWMTLGGTVLLLAMIAGVLGFVGYLLGSLAGSPSRKRPAEDWWDDDAAPEKQRTFKVNQEAPRPPARSATHKWPGADG